MLSPKIFLHFKERIQTYEDSSVFTKHHFPRKRNFHLVTTLDESSFFLYFLGCILNFFGSDDPQAARLKLNLTDQEASEE